MLENKNDSKQPPISITPAEFKDAMADEAEAIIKEEIGRVVTEIKDDVDELVKVAAANEMTLMVDATINEKVADEVHGQVKDVAERVGIILDAKSADQDAKIDQVVTALQQDAAVAANNVQEQVQLLQQASADITTQVAKIQEQVTTQAESTQATAADKNATHLAKITKVHSYGSLIINILLIVVTLSSCAIAIVLAQMYLGQRSANEQQIATYEKTIAELQLQSNHLAHDLINCQLVKNDNIDTAIQNKIDSLKNEGKPESKAIPMAYIDGDIVKEVIIDLPSSLTGLPFTEDMVREELKQIAIIAEKGLAKKSP